MNILLLTGESGAGKSTIAREVSRARKGSHLAERELSRALARENGFNRSRQWLQTVGMATVADALCDLTIKNIQGSGEQLIIVDGAYDRRLPEIIRFEIPQAKLAIVAVTASLGHRIERMARRLGNIAPEDALKEVELLDSYKTAVGAEELVASADLTIVNEGALEDACQQIYDLLDRM